jgi:hypothetical protein
MKVDLKKQSKKTKSFADQLKNLEDASIYMDKLDAKISLMLFRIGGPVWSVRIMSQRWVMHPKSMIKRAIKGNLITMDQVNEDLVNGAISSAEEINDDYLDSGEGFGSSDGTYAIKSMLDYAGYKTGWVDNRLEILK